MITYILKRLLLVIPTLLLVSVLVFMLCSLSPHDPAVSQAQGEENPAVRERIIKDLYKRWNLDLPLFYISLSNLAQPDTLYRITLTEERAALSRLADRTGNWKEVIEYRRAIRSLNMALLQVKDSIKGEEKIQPIIGYFPQYHKDENIRTQLTLLKKICTRDSQLSFAQPHIDNILQQYTKLTSNSSTWKRYIPRLVIHGLENQYHKWIAGIVTRFDFGTSYANEGMSVITYLKAKIPLTIFFSLFTILFAYSMGLFLGIWTARKHNSLFDKIVMIITFALRSVPGFWFALLLIILFANPDIFDWFPSTFNTMGKYPIARFVLPLIAYIYSSFALISRMMRSSLLDNLNQDYIRTARAKGLSENKVVMRHALRNSLFPVITMITATFPAILSGSIILEKIFTINGMGLATIQAFFANDTPVLLAISMIIGSLTILGYLVADVLYAVADPRIKLQRTKR